MTIRRWLVLDPDYGDAVGAASTQHEAEQIASDYVPPYPVVEVVPASDLEGAVTALGELLAAASSPTRPPLRSRVPAISAGNSSSGRCPVPDWPAYRPVDPGPFYVNPCTPDGAPDVLDVRPWTPAAPDKPKETSDDR